MQSTFQRKQSASVNTGTAIAYSSLYFGVQFCIGTASLVLNMYIEAVGISVGKRSAVRCLLVVQS